MKLMTIDEYQEHFYTPTSCPSRRKIIRLIKEGSIVGRKLGMLYYIDIEAETSTTGNTLVDRVLQQS